jgi:hypothetical protein
MKRRVIERDTEERDNAEIRRQKDEIDQLQQMYQQEKDRQRRQDAKFVSDFHLKQTVIDRDCFII